jgi:hypothetical protein
MTGVRAEVFLLSVSRQRRTWLELVERETCWYDPEDAAELVEEPELAAILQEVRALACTAQ